MKRIFVIAALAAALPQVGWSANAPTCLATVQCKRGEAACTGWADDKRFAECGIDHGNYLVCRTVYPGTAGNHDELEELSYICCKQNGSALATVKLAEAQNVCSGI